MKKHIVVGFVVLLAFTAGTILLTAAYIRVRQGDFAVALPAPFFSNPSLLRNFSKLSLDNAEQGLEEGDVESIRTVRHPFCPGRNVRNKGMRSNEYGLPSKLSWQNATTFTSGRFSSFAVRGKHGQFRVCDQLELVIQARNGLYQAKTYGGDYFRARIFTKNRTFAASSSTDGELFDHGNGSYSALFTLKWAGIVIIEVTLVHPSEAIHLLRQIQREGLVEAHFLGGFRAEKSSEVEATLCDISLQKHHGPLCNFTDEKSGFPWFCRKPQNLSCKHRFGHRLRPPTDVWNETRFNDRHSQLPFLKANMRISGAIASIVVQSQREGASSVVHSSALARLPSCHPAALGSQADVSGFYWGEHWYSSTCKIRHFSTQEALECLQSKTVYLLGDSTIRQLFKYYAETFKLKTSIKENSSNWYIGPMKMLENDFDINITYRFHGYPIARARNWEITANIDYVVNVLNSIRDYENVTIHVVVLSLGVHFIKHPPAVFEARIQSIVGAIHRLHERSPQTFILFKSANTREHKLVEHYVVNSDWLTRDLDWRLRRIISEENNVGFLDAWDMTNIQFDKHAIHPRGPHVLNLSNQMLSYICPEVK